jgi:hypothetical protein
MDTYIDFSCNSSSYQLNWVGLFFIVYPDGWLGVDCKRMKWPQLDGMKGGTTRLYKPSITVFPFTKQALG